MKRCQKYIENVTTKAEPDDHHPFCQANLDLINRGLFDDNRNRKRPIYVAYVNDHLCADIAFTSQEQ